MPSRIPEVLPRLSDRVNMSPTPAPSCISQNQCASCPTIPAQQAHKPRNLACNRSQVMQPRTQQAKPSHPTQLACNLARNWTLSACKSHKGHAFFSRPLPHWLHHWWQAQGQCQQVPQGPQGRFWWMPRMMMLQPYPTSSLCKYDHPCGRHV